MSGAGGVGGPGGAGGAGGTDSSNSSSAGDGDGASGVADDGGTTAEGLGGVPDPIGLIVFLLALCWFQGLLLNRLRCQHCNRLLCKRTFSLDGFLFWQLHLYFEKRCPHRDRSALSLWN